jgi:YVTN family beta-propeller protein
MSELPLRRSTPPNPSFASTARRSPSYRTASVGWVLGATALLLLAGLGLGAAGGSRWAGTVPPGSPAPTLHSAGVAPDRLPSVPLGPNPPSDGFHLPYASWLAFNPVDQAYYVAAPNASVDIINASSAALGVNFTVSVGQSPFGVAVDSLTGDVFVTNSGSDTVSVLQGDQTTPIATVAVGDDPTGIAWDIANDQVYVANQGANTVSVINAAGSNYSVVSTLDVGLEPLGVAVANIPFAPSGPTTSYVFVANEGSSNVSVINGTMRPGASYVLTAVGAGDEPYGVAWDNASNDSLPLGTIYVTNQGSGNVSVISITSPASQAPSFQTVATIPVIGSAGVLQGIAYDSGSQTVWAGAGTLYAVVLDPSTWTVADYVGVDPSGVAYNPDNGNVCVTNAGNLTFECLSFPNAITSPTSNLTFDETGLPSGSPWSVTIGPYGPTQSSTTSQITVQVLPGSSYAYQVGTLDPLYYASPSSGTVAVPHSTTVSVNFIAYNASQALASVSFQVGPLSSPLPNDTTYWVDVDGLAGTSGVPGDVNFTLGPGDYTWTVLPVSGYSAGPFTSTVAISGPGSTTVNLTFFPIGNDSFPLQFTETGLPNNAYWQVNIVGGTYGGTTLSTQSFGWPAGDWDFTVGAPAGYYANPASGEFDVYGGLLNVGIAFSQSASSYPVSFNETGLPSGTIWSVSLAGTSAETTSGAVAITEPNGTWVFQIYDTNTSPVYVPEPTNGTVLVNGYGATVTVTFAPAVTTYPVSFVETGLPSATTWSVTFDGATDSATSATLIASAANGTRFFTVGSVAGYIARPAVGTVTVTGAAATVNITFSTAPTVPVFPVDIVESGLPSGASWGVSLNGTFSNSTASTRVFYEPNGSYALVVTAAPSNYTANYSTPVVVAGAAVTVGVSFSVTAYVVTFLESGLPSGTSWTVTAVDEATQVATPGRSDGAEVALRLADGTYSLTASGPTGYQVSLSPASVIVHGGNPGPVAVAFTSPNPGGTVPGALTNPLVAEAGIVTVLLASLAAAWGYARYRYGQKKAEGEGWARELQAEGSEPDGPRTR